MIDIKHNRQGINYGILSPGARYWAYIQDTLSRRTLILRDMVKKKERILVTSLLGKVPFASDAQRSQTDYAFSSDAGYIYIAYGGKIHCINTQTGENHLIPFRATVHIAAGPLDYNKYPVS